MIKTRMAREMGGCRHPLKSIMLVFASALVSISVLAAGDGFSSGGDATWYRDSPEMWVSGEIASDQGDSWIETKVTGPGTLSYYWGVACESGKGSLELYVNNNLITVLNPDRSWYPVSYVLSEGTHTIKVCYRKSGTSSSGYIDCGWIKNWRWVPVLNVGKYAKMTLSGLGYDVPTNGTPYSVVALGLPAGMQLRSNAAVKNSKGRVVKKAKVEWWVEGVPTAALRHMTNPAYLVITANGKTETYPFPVTVFAQDVVEHPDLDLGQTVKEQFFLPGVTNGWTVTGLPTGLKYTAKLLTTKKKVGKRTVVTTNALPYSVYGKTTKAGLFTVTAKKKVGAYYETLRYRVFVTPREVDESLFGDSLTNITTMAYVPAEWFLTNDVSAVGGKVAKVTGLPTGLTFAASDTYAYKNAKKETGKYLRQKGQTIIGTPTRPGTYVVSFTKNVRSGKTTVAKTAQIVWTIIPNDVDLKLHFNDVGGAILCGTMGVRCDPSQCFTATEDATVAALGLPPGITLVQRDENKWGFAGFSTKAGTYLVTVTATHNGITVQQRLALKIEALPRGAKGTFNGQVYDAAWAMTGLATITVSSAGKISGKFQELGTNWTVSASSYMQMDAKNAYLAAPVTARFTYKVKVGKATVTRYITRDFKLEVFEDSGYMRLIEDAGGWEGKIFMHQNLWGTTYKALGSQLFYTSKKKPYKTFVVSGDSEEGTKLGMKPEMTLSLKVKPDGSVAATLSFDTGKTKKDPKTKKTVKVIYKATCSSVVIPNTPVEAEEFSGKAYLYFAPSPANGFPGLATYKQLPN